MMQHTWDMADREIEEWKARAEKAEARAEEAESTADAMKDAIDWGWRKVYADPKDPEWEYPGQGVRHLWQWGDEHRERADKAMAQVAALRWALQGAREGLVDLGRRICPTPEGPATEADAILDDQVRGIWSIVNAALSSTTQAAQDWEQRVRAEERERSLDCVRDAIAKSPPDGAVEGALGRLFDAIALAEPEGTKP